MNSLSCLSRFSRDPPNVVSILIQKMNFFFRSTSTIFFFTGIISFLFVFVHLWKMPQLPHHYYIFFNFPKLIEIQPHKQTVTIPLTFD